MKSVLENVNRSVSRQKTSSTRGDFLDLEGNFLSCDSSTVFTDMSGQSGSDTDGARALPIVCDICGKGEKGNCEVCLSNGTTTVPLAQALAAALNKIDHMSEQLGQLCTAIGNVDSKVTKVNRNLGQLDKRVKKIETQSEYDSASDQARVSAVTGGARRKAYRVNEERERTHVVAQDQIRSLRKSRAPSDSEGQPSEGLLLSDITKTMPREKKERCNSRVSNILSDIGATFPDDDTDAISSTSSGKESDSSSRRRVRRRVRKVKSGAEIEKRPVIKTELWPHTVANEEDGEGVNSENITLSKFISCFTLIMAGCEGVELQGRSALLRAVGMVLEVLPWAEARNFHNLTMVKIEQGRINWRQKFSLLANEFVDKKVRQNLRSKGTSSGGGFNSRGNQSYRGQGRGSSYPNSNRGQGGSGGNNRPFSLVCWQWNTGNCTFGKKCKRWHCCRSCAEKGKWGEPHTATSHGSSGPETQSNQQV